MGILALHCKKLPKLFIKDPRTVKMQKNKKINILVTKKDIEKISNGFELLGPKSLNVSRKSENFFSWALMVRSVIDTKKTC